MIIVVGEMRYEAGEIERLRPALTVLAEASRALPGCLHYSLSVDVIDPDLLLISHRWEDEEAMAGYYISPALAAYGREIVDDKVVAMSTRAYTADFLRTMLSKEG